MARRMRRKLRRLNKRIGRLQDKGMFPDGSGQGMFPDGVAGGNMGAPDPYQGAPQGGMGNPGMMAGGNMSDPMMGGYGQNPYMGGMAGGNMSDPGMMPGGNMGGYGQDPGMAGGNMGDYIDAGKGAYPNMGQWRPDRIRPQQPVDVLPGEAGGGGYGGPTPFAGGSKRWRKKMNRKMKRQHRRSKRQGGGGRRGQGGGFDVSNPVMSNMVMQSANQMWPGVGNMMQSNPGAGGAFMGRMGFPNRRYPEFHRGFTGGGRDAGSPG